MKIKSIGYLALLIGIVLAIIIGIIENLGVFPAMIQLWLPLILVIGLIIGILNLATRDAVVFLITVLVLAITTSLISVAGVLGLISKYIMTVSAVAGFIVAVRAAYAMSFK